MATPNGNGMPSWFKWIRQGGVILLLAIIVVELIRGDLVPKGYVDQLLEQEGHALENCQAGRSALEATLRAYTAREAEK